jgi:hypothetical protein
VDSSTGFKRIILKVKGTTTLLGFCKATSSNLPSVDLWMLAEYLSQAKWPIDGIAWTPKQLGYFCEGNPGNVHQE